MWLYLKVTNDKLSLPLAVAESTKELAAIVGVTPEAVRSGIHNGKNKRVKYPSYIKVKVED